VRIDRSIDRGPGRPADHQRDGSSRSGSSEYELAGCVDRRPARACVRGRCPWPAFGKKAEPAGRGIRGRGLSTCALAYVRMSPIRYHECINQPTHLIGSMRTLQFCAALCSLASMFACSWRALSHRIGGPAPAGMPITAVAHCRGAAGDYYFGRTGGVVATGRATATASPRQHSSSR